MKPRKNGDFHGRAVSFREGRWWFQRIENFQPYLGKISHLTNIFQMGWHHQPVVNCNLRFHKSADDGAKCRSCMPEAKTIFHRNEERMRNQPDRDPDDRISIERILFKFNLNWTVLSDEQMSNGWQFSLLNDEQMSNKVGVEHQPVKYVFRKYHCCSMFGFSFILVFYFFYARVRLCCCQNPNRLSKLGCVRPFLSNDPFVLLPKPKTPNEHQEFIFEDVYENHRPRKNYQWVSSSEI